MNESCGCSAIGLKLAFHTTPAYDLPAMEPEIRYVRSADGTRIATWTLGSGPPLIVAPSFAFGTMQIAWEFPGLRAQLEVLAQQHTVVAYDFRGFGLSDHDVEDLSLSALVADLDAVAGAVSGGPIDIWARIGGGPAAIAWAAHNPRARRLVLQYTTAKGANFRLSAQRKLLSQLVPIDFELYAQTMALIDFGWTDTARRAAEIIKDLNPETFARCWRARRDWDASAYLGQISCPTLVVYTPIREELVTLDDSRSLAAAIPGARLVVQKGTPLTAREDGLALGRVVADFLSGDQEAAPFASGTATILFADIVESTALTERLGDAAFHAQARQLHDRMRRIVSDGGGNPIEGRLLGDGLLAVFHSAAQAVAAGLACSSAGNAGDLPVRVGLHAGDVIVESGDVYGGAVNLAARLAAAAQPGEVMVSETVRSLARTSAAAIFEDRGAHTLKGIAEPQHLFAARARPR